MPQFSLSFDKCIYYIQYRYFRQRFSKNKMFQDLLTIFRKSVQSRIFLFDRKDEELQINVGQLMRVRQNHTLLLVMGSKFLVLAWLWKCYEVLIDFSGRQYTNKLILLYKGLMQPLFYSQDSAFKNLRDTEKSSQQTQISKNIFLFSAINQQFLLTQHLIQNQIRLTEQLKKQKQSSDSGQSSLPNEQNINKINNVEEQQDFKFASDNQDDNTSSIRSPKQQEPLTRLRIRKVFKYDVDSQSDNQKKQTKKCETKNIIKNFMKSIFNFMRKHPAYMKKISKQYSINQQNFKQQTYQLDGKVNTILQLRQFWTQKQYSNVYRIVSEYFLRTYSLKHIFHSRIANHQIHLKYRHKLLDSIKRPTQFTSLKDF